MRTLTLMLALLAACSPLDRGPSEDRPDGPVPVHHGTNLLAKPDAVDALVLPILEDRGVGMGVAVVHDGEGVFSGGYGWADLGDARPLTAGTPMQIGSVSKLFIGVAAMQARDRGDLSLDDPIADLVGFAVDNPLVEDDVITLRALLMHNGGIHDSGEYDRAYANGDPTVSLLDFQRSYLLPGGERYHVRNFTKVGSGTFEYSNVGAALAGLGLAETAGLEFSDLVHRDILEPLGMSHSAYFVDDLAVEMATPYGGGDRPFGVYSFPTYPDGLMRSSSTDMGRFMAAIQAGGVLDDTRILEEATVEEMLTVDESSGTDEDGQAISWARVALVEGRTLMGHTGGDPGVASLFAMDRDAGVGVVLTANSVDLDLHAVVEAYGALFDLERAP